MSSVTSLIANTTGNILLPAGTSTVAKEVDFTFYFILGVGAFFFALIMTLIIVFVKKYRHRKEGPKADVSITHNTKLEVIWSVIPLILLVTIFVLGYRGYLRMTIPPANALRIHVTGEIWTWSMEYPVDGVRSSRENGKTVFVVPKGRSVLLRLTSKDVLHSFYIPNFRLKGDAVPGQYTELWFEATDEGSYPIFCAEYCGTGHSTMLAVLKVVSEEKYKEWVHLQKNQSVGKTALERGQKLFNDTHPCWSCHATKDAPGQPTIGPSLYKAFGRFEKVLENGKLQEVKIDENYIRQSILEPNTKIVEGYPASMPTFSGKINDQEISDLIEYIKSLK